MKITSWQMQESQDILEILRREEPTQISGITHWILQHTLNLAFLALKDLEEFSLKFLMKVPAELKRTYMITYVNNQAKFIETKPDLFCKQISFNLAIFDGN